MAGLASAIGANEDIDAGRRPEIKRLESREPLQLHYIDHHDSTLVRVAVSGLASNVALEHYGKVC